MKTYLLYDGRLYKIGQTNNMNQRMASIRNANPYIEILGHTDKISESKLHSAFSKYRVKLEWFNLKDGQVQAILDSFNTGNLILQNDYWYELMESMKLFKKYDSMKIRNEINDKIQKDTPIVKNNLFEWKWI